MIKPCIFTTRDVVLEFVLNLNTWFVSNYVSFKMAYDIELWPSSSIAHVLHFQCAMWTFIDYMLICSPTLIDGTSIGQFDIMQPFVLVFVRLPAHHSMNGSWVLWPMLTINNQFLSTHFSSSNWSPGGLWSGIECEIFRTEIKNVFISIFNFVCVHCKRDVNKYCFVWISIRLNES